MFRKSKKMSSMSSQERSDLQENKKRKQSKFAWLANFLRRRHNVDQIQEEDLDSPTFFGVTVAKVYQNPGNLEQNIPRPIFSCAKALQPFVSVEGLFRVSGIFSEMNRFKDLFEKGQEPDYQNIGSIHSIAGLLELWFRELPEPLTTHALYDDFMESVAEDVDEGQSVSSLTELVAKLSEETKTVLSFFLQLMEKVAEKQPENKMGSNNLGVVFGSILLGGAVLCFSLGLKATLERQNKVVQLLIDHHKKIVPGYTFPLFDTFE